MSLQGFFGKTFKGAVLNANGYWVQDGAGIWTNLASAVFGGSMAREGDRLRLDFQTCDGGQFDADGAISGAGAPAHMALSMLGQAPDSGAHGFWF